MTPTEKAADLRERLRDAATPIPRGATGILPSRRLYVEALAEIEAQAAEIAQLRSYLGRSQEEAGELLTRATKAEARLAEAGRLLEDAVLQIHYLHEKFQETASGNTVLAYARAFLNKEPLEPTDALRAQRTELARKITILGHHCFWLPDWGYTKPDQESAQALVTKTLERTASMILEPNMREDFEARQRAFLNKEPSDVQS